MATTNALSFILMLIILTLSPTHAWLASQYFELNVTTDDIGQTYTITQNVVPTGSVTPIRASTETGADITVENFYLSGSNLPVSAPSIFGFQPTITGPPVVTIYYAPATITQPPTCSQTQFSYTTEIQVFPPTQMFHPPNSIAFTSSTTFMTTTVYTNADGQPTSTTSWSEIDFYVATGQVVPTLDSDTIIMLKFCQDPRGCYLGQGKGCTAKGTGLAGFTESNRPTATSTGKKNEGGRSGPMVHSGETWLVWAMVSGGAAFGMILLL